MIKDGDGQKKDKKAAPDEKTQRTWATFCHLSALSLFIGIILGNLLGPLIIWLLKKNDMPLVNEEGKAAVNFQISMTIYAIVIGVLCIIGVGFLLLIPFLLAFAILVVMASIKTSNGEKFNYPCTIHFIK